MHIRAYDDPIRTNEHFEAEYARKVRALITRDPVRRGPAHATTDETMAMTHELMHLREVFLVDREASAWVEDRKSTRLNSSHVEISYAVFCLKKKNREHSPVDHHQ